MTTEEDEIKNGLIKTAFRWPGGVVPYYIKEEDFGNSIPRYNKEQYIKQIRNFWIDRRRRRYRGDQKRHRGLPSEHVHTFSPLRKIRYRLHHYRGQIVGMLVPGRQARSRPSGEFAESWMRATWRDRARADARTGLLSSAKRRGSRRMGGDQLGKYKAR